MSTLALLLLVSLPYTGPRLLLLAAAARRVLGARARQGRPTWRLLPGPPAALQSGRTCAAGSGARVDCAAPAPAASAVGERGVSPTAAKDLVHLFSPRRPQDVLVHRPQVGAVGLATPSPAAPTGRGNP